MEGANLLIRAVLRRREEQPTDILKVGTLTLDPRSSYVKYENQEILLTAKEFAIMHFFMQRPDKLLSRTEILENVWDSNYDGFGNVVDVYINYLCNKLEETGKARVIRNGTRAWLYPERRTQWRLASHSASPVPSPCSSD